MTSLLDRDRIREGALVVLFFFIPLTTNKCKGARATRIVCDDCEWVNNEYDCEYNNNNRQRVVAMWQQHRCCCCCCWVFRTNFHFSICSPYFCSAGWLYDLHVQSARSLWFGFSLAIAAMSMILHTAETKRTWSVALCNYVRTIFRQLISFWTDCASQHVELDGKNTESCERVAQPMER